MYESNQLDELKLMELLNTLKMLPVNFLSMLETASVHDSGVMYSIDFFRDYKTYLSSINQSHVHFNLDLKLTMEFAHYKDFDQLYTSDTVRWLEAFGDRITGIALTFAPSLSQSNVSKILNLIIDGCPNLISVAVRHHVNAVELANRPRLNSSLTSLFSDPDRARRLLKLQFQGHVDYQALLTLFENCLSLEKLSIFGCPELGDEHLVWWSDRGGGVQLRKLAIVACANVSDHGLIPVLRNSGDQLAVFRYDSLLADEASTPVADRIWCALFEYCRYLIKANGPEKFLGMAREKNYLKRLG